MAKINNRRGFAVRRHVIVIHDNPAGGATHSELVQMQMTSVEKYGGRRLREGGIEVGFSVQRWNLPSRHCRLCCYHCQMSQSFFLFFFSNVGSETTKKIFFIFPFFVKKSPDGKLQREVDILLLLLLSFLSLSLSYSFFFFFNLIYLIFFRRREKGNISRNKVTATEWCKRLLCIVGYGFKENISIFQILFLVPVQKSFSPTAGNSFIKFWLHPIFQLWKSQILVSTVFLASVSN